jgi:hypothetical protein
MSKLVVSITLIHKRLANVNAIVKGFLTGETKPDKIYFFVSEEEFFKDKGIKPEELPKINNKVVEFVYVENNGPIRKWIPILKMYWDEPDTKIVCFDDDRYPKVDTLSTLVKYSNMFPNSAIGLAGPNLHARYPSSIKANKTNLGWGRLVTEPINVSYLSSGIGALTKPKFFSEDIFEWKKHSKDLGLRLTDEVFIAYNLAKNGIERKVVPIKTRVNQITDDGRKGGSRFKKRQLAKWHKIIGNYYEGGDMITAIIQSYRRPENIPIIIEAIKNQTFKPERIIVWNDNDGSGKDLHDLGSGIEIINTNTNHNGNYGAFLSAYLADSKYIAVIDDDCPPGPEWFQFCMHNLKKNWVFSEFGVRLKNNRYTGRTPIRVRVGKQIRLNPVDMVGHSYFFYKEAVLPMFSIRPPSWFNNVDLHFSFMARRSKFKLFVPTVTTRDEMPNDNRIKLPFGMKEKSMFGRGGHMKRRDEYVKWAIGKKLIRVKPHADILP